MRGKKLHNLRYVVVQHKVSAHHSATGEYGVEMNRYLRLCLESEGRGDGWDRIHAFIRES